MKILVTGATGFVGHHLAKRLKKEGYNLRILKEKNQSLGFLKNLELEIIEGDIRNFEDVKKAVKGCDVVFHLAGIVSYWRKLQKLQYEVNVLGTKNIVKACLEYKIKRLIHVSSTAAVGYEKNKLANEETSFNLFPLRVNYCNTKFLGEVEVLRGIAKGLDAVIVCPGSIYGEGDLRRIKSDMIFNFKFPFSLFYMQGGVGVVDIKDVVEGLLKAWKKGKRGERYILVGENLSFYEIRKMIAKALGKKPPKICLSGFFLYFLSYLFLLFSFISGKKPRLTPEMVRFHKLYLYFSNEKAKKELGIKFTPFEETIKRAVKWYKSHGFL